MAKEETQPTQQFIDIREVKNDIVILKNGSLRRILMVSGINFELKSEEEQNLIIYAYQNFLNTLDFSIQIVIHSRKLNIGSYIEKLSLIKDQEENELLKSQTGEYIEFIKSFMESNEIMAKNFFVVIPYDPIVIPGSGKKFLGILGFGKKEEPSVAQETLERKLSQLNQRTDQVMSGLTQIGLRAVALNNEELIELFYNLYNPEATERKELKIAQG